jgi:arylsulfate sulfotransferase
MGKFVASHIYAYFFLFVLVFASACDSDDSDGSNTVLLADPVVALNPSGVAPLTANITFNTSASVKASLRIVGKNGSESDVRHNFDELNTAFSLHVLGLYADFDNTVELIISDTDGREIERRELSIQTAPLIEEMPFITIDASIPGSMATGMNLVNYFGHNGQFLPQRPFIFDRFGDIRWYLDFSNHPTLSNLFYDNGLTRMQNGNLLFGNGNDGNLYEINMLGEIVNTWSLQGYGFHHTVIELPGGNFLVTVNDPEKPTVEDVVIEISRTSGQVVTVWDLNESLDNQRSAWPTDLADLNVDWFHANGLAYDANNDAIIVSGRTQGAVKLTRDNEVIWILAPHRGWDTSGNGTNLSEKLLQPLDVSGAQIDDFQVLDGAMNHPEFEWSWYQHSPILLPNGNLMLFDNGDTRNYTGTFIYSRAVEYAIDEPNMTIRQVWDYGKNRGLETYSRIVSKVSYLEEKGNVLFTPGAVNFGNEIGKVVEVNQLSGQVVFEATIRAPIAPFSINFHNSLRMHLYDR